MFTKTAALFLAAALAAPLAQALPVITFNGIGYGANVAEFYNGGTDSSGNIGYNYGISFSAIVVANAAGPYVAGHASMTFAADLFGANTPFYIKFNASRYDVDGGNSYIYGKSADSVNVSGNGDPFCNTEAECAAKGYLYIYHSSMGGYVLYSDGTATTVSFNTDRLDNIQFVLASDVGASARPASLIGTSELDRAVPEPASIALLGVGALGLLAMRRRKTA